LVIFIIHSIWLLTLISLWIFIKVKHLISFFSVVMENAELTFEGFAKVDPLRVLIGSKLIECTA